MRLLSRLSRRQPAVSFTGLTRAQALERVGQLARGLFLTWVGLVLTYAAAGAWLLWNQQVSATVEQVVASSRAFIQYTLGFGVVLVLGFVPIVAIRVGRLYAARLK